MAGEIKLVFPVFIPTGNPRSQPGQKQKVRLFRVVKWTHPELKATDVCMALFTSLLKAEMFIRGNPSVMGQAKRGIKIESPQVLRTLLTKLKAKQPEFEWVGMDVVNWNRPFNVGRHRVVAVLKALDDHLQ